MKIYFPVEKRDYFMVLALFIPFVLFKFNSRMNGRNPILIDPITPFFVVVNEVKVISEPFSLSHSITFAFLSFHIYLFIILIDLPRSYNCTSVAALSALHYYYYLPHAIIILKKRSNSGAHNSSCTYMYLSNDIFE